MKLFSVALALASFASATVISSRGGKVNYDGYKVFRVDASEGLNVVEEKIAALSALALHGHEDHWDVAVAPDNVAAFEASELSAQLLTEDLGAAIATEGEIQPYDGEYLV